METFFLACFAIGVLFTVASLALGSISGGHFGHSGGHIGDSGHIGHPHVAHAPHADLRHNGSLPLLNASSIVGGLTWFGAAGYLVLKLGGWALPVAFLIALVAAALGWYVIARFLGLVLKGEVEMNPDDYRLEGTVGQVTVSIPAGGTGEVVFSKAGTRRSEAARSADHSAIPRGSEVVITAYADGFATVQPWREFIAERERLAAAQKRE